MGKFDEIFDDVVVNAKACASAVSQKASTVYDVSKHKITAAEIRGDINKKLRELGALTYKSEVHGTDNSQQIKLIVSEISDLKDNLNVVNEHIAVAKDQRRCPGCNALTHRTFSAGASVYRLLTIDCFRENLGNRRLTCAAGSAKKIGMSYTVSLYLILQGSNDMLLPLYILKLLRTEFTI